MRGSLIRKLTAAAVVIAAAVAVSGCHSIDDDRIPPCAVYLPFNTEPDWVAYGAVGACSWRTFIKADRLPSNYPWTALCETGYGGILLVSDIHGNPQAFDLACPVEAKPTVGVAVDTELQKAVCPKCGSIYEMFTNYGYPVGGPAAEDGFALRRYRVGAGSQGQFMIVTY